ncbi:MAG TPA: condensation domain-containing protein, partial [Thermoanaerobaculia bacterium]|nr:condensation domain-containing protein [Thermoanaerobaculia bacterium]
MNTHRGIVNRLLWMQERYGLTADDRVLQKTPFSFDVSVWEFFWPLLVGARLVVARPGGHQDPAYLVETIRREGITTLHFVPSMLQVFLEAPGVEECRSVKRVIASGEALPPELEQRFFARLGATGAGLFNLYGPTEAAVDVTHWDCSPGAGRTTVPIGRPVANTSIHLVGRYGEPVPVGVPGELLIGGMQVARGYLGRPELTAERFVPDPFGGAGARVYRTGDLARRRPDGAIEYLGRLDHQVKIRGFRIELGEIEAALASHPAVREAVVQAREQRLVAWVVGRDGALETAELRRHLAATLPEYMVPSALVVLPEMPLSPNGKVDRKALARIEPEARSTKHYVAPRTPVEELLAGIWGEVLGCERVGVHDNFFALGGHSLLATRLASRVRETFGVDLALRRIFETHTVAGLAQELEGRGPDHPRAAPLRRLPRPAELPLSHAQERLWFLDRFEPGSALYNIPTAAVLRGSLDVAALGRALDEIVRRHEVLRTGFAVVGGRAVQRVAPWSPSSLPMIDLSGLAGEAPEAVARRLAYEEAVRPFDLEAPPLVRAGLLRLAPETHLALFTFHHIAADGWSIDVFLRELAELYGAFRVGRPPRLPALPLQYADFAVWQREWLQGEVLEGLLGFGRTALEGAPAALERPTDRPRRATRDSRGAHLGFHLPDRLGADLEALARREAATPFM